MPDFRLLLGAEPTEKYCPGLTMLPASAVSAFSVDTGVEGLKFGSTGWAVEDETREGGIVAVKLKVGLESFGKPKVNGLTAEEFVEAVVEGVELIFAKAVTGAVEDGVIFSTEEAVNGGGQIEDIGVVVTVVVVVDEDKLALELVTVARDGIE